MKKVTRNGILAYHPSKSGEAQRLLETLKTRLNGLYPGFDFWAVGSATELLKKQFQGLAPNQDFEIIPILLFPGQHYRLDVHGLAEELRLMRPDIQVRVAPCLLEREHFIEALLEVF